MKAIVKTRTSVAVRTVPVPRISAGDVLIKVAMAGLCRTDTYAARGTLKVKEGTILGHEFSGTIEQVGRSVRKLKRGDRVAVMPIVSNKQGDYVGPMLGVNTHGAYAEFIRVPQNLVFKIPNSLDFRKAAYTEPVAASLAVLEAPIKKNQKGIIIGSSRIATLTHRLMRLSGFRSVRIVTPLALRAIPDNSCDFAIETLVNEEIFAEMVRIVKPKGVIVLKSRQHIPAPLSVAAVVKKDLTLRGTHYGSFKKAIALMAENAVKVDDILGPVLSLEEGVRILQSGGWEQGNRKIFFTAHS